MATDHLIVFCTVPDQSTALSISKTLVTEQLAACCNILPGVRSVYMWDGQLCDDTELLLVIKTRQSAYQDLEKRVVELHPYDVPEVLAITINSGFKQYLKWMDANVEEK